MTNGSEQMVMPVAHMYGSGNSGFGSWAATADVKYTIANEACATRQASTANTQAILDKLCQLELDGYKRENDNLRTQLNMATLSASQTAQNAFILFQQEDPPPLQAGEDVTLKFLLDFVSIV